ncbi:pyruvate, phosphate dikinase [Paenibacillus sp. 453mf]|uniref:pyruvate, phosphate dikinase n=1 Tax=Paenibacillus sp. 453mf TaxID=1761874 RepID=UPI0008EB8284|nr:pyruvate, phosphate dikinase [Paenibacillus sp. 453mf]SFS50406.1 pyruvate phosphate dikinase [Paenibacillus sp. 453mf]
MTDKRVFMFSEGNASMRELLGGKGADLAEMTRAGLPVPYGFTITTASCRDYYTHLGHIPLSLIEEIEEALVSLEQKTGKTFGDTENPLFVAVRSGAVTSMPGMMDTILNLGMNDETTEGLAAISGNRKYALECYARFIQMYGHVVMGIENNAFSKLLRHINGAQGTEHIGQLEPTELEELIHKYKSLIQQRAKKPMPQNVREQVIDAVRAIFRSWSNPRAKVYRKVHKISEDQGTAVSVQEMVFGNLDEYSGTGVLFTRNPSTGVHEILGEYLPSAQGEEVVMGIRTPFGISYLAQTMPAVYEELHEAASKLEAWYGDIQDIEFTIEQGKLYILQTRGARRTAQAAMKAAVDYAKEGIITKEEALLRIEPEHLNQLLHQSIEAQDVDKVVATGLPASPGAVSGALVFDSETAEAWTSVGKRVILVRRETTPQDIHGVIAAEGLLTLRGGMTSHAAVVARGMGTPCVCGCEEMELREDKKELICGKYTFQEGDLISLDGATGQVYAGEIKLKDPEISEELSLVLSWADEVKHMKVYANIDQPGDVKYARKWGAEGIGLCRTEHMFLSPSRLPLIQRVIVAGNAQERQEALYRLMPIQQSDFEQIFTEMDGLPVTIRLLDPPLHEFLPKLEVLEGRKEHLRMITMDGDTDELDKVERVISKVQELRETNPMLGWRGARLGIVFPEIYDMQIEAIFRAAANCIDRGISVVPEIMIPLIGHANELSTLRKLVDEVAEQVLRENLRHCPYRVGTMIEVPRAALTAAEIAKHADFFSFGTNDLTQMTLGYSRDDAERRFLSQYMEQKIIEANPFEVLDEEGVGELMKLALSRGRTWKPHLVAGLCGEHGGDRDSIRFCHQIGLDYVSCSPYRVPFARIAAAQAEILERDVSASNVGSEVTSTA